MNRSHHIHCVRWPGALCALALLAAQATTGSAADNWTGTIRSEINITASGYAHQETQTWTLTGGVPTTQGSSKIYAATWDVTGQGWHDRTNTSNSQRIASWTASVSGRSAPVSFLVTPTGELQVQVGHAQLTAPKGYTGKDEVIQNGVPFSSRRLEMTIYEWAFPRIQGLPTDTQLTGTHTSQPVAFLGPLQPSGAQVTVTCTWALGQGSAPPLPPSTLPAQPPAPGANPPPARAPREPAPQLLSISPAEVNQGAPDVHVTLQGQGTHWRTDVTTADFGPDIRVAELTVKSPTQIEAWIQVYPSAAIGSRAVSLTTLASPRPEVVSLPDRFTVNAVLTTAPGPILAPAPGSVDVAPVRPPERPVVPEPPTAEVTPVRPPEREAAPGPVAPVRGIRERPPGGLTPLLPAITDVTPNAAAQWTENLTITVTARNSNFAPGTTNIDLGPGVIWAGDYFSIESPTRVLGSFRIAGDAAPGSRDVTVRTGDETLTLPNAFIVTPRAARDVFRLTPETAQQGQSNLTVNISTFQWRYFQLGTTFDFGPGISVVSSEVQSEFAARAVINVDAAAAVESRAVTVRRPDGRVDVFSDVFTVTASPARIIARPDHPVLRRPGGVPAGSTPTLSLAPNNAVRGSTNVYVMITGTGTNFVHPVTTADFGPGVAVQFVEVPAAPLQAKAVLNIAPNAVPGKRTVTVTTNNEVVTLTDGFLVKGAATPPQAANDQFSVRRDRKLVAGAVLVSRFDSLAPNSGSTSGGFARAGQRLFFQARKGTEQGLWTSDGTPGGTRFVSPMQVRNLTGVGNRAFFTATTPGQGEVLWVTDGAASGTQVVKDVRAGSDASSFFSFHEVNGALFFVMETLNAVGQGSAHALWRSDGTAAGTFLLKSDMMVSNGQQTLLAQANGAVYFVAIERVGSTFERWLWKTDGTTAGTVKVHEMTIGYSGGRESSRPIRAAGPQLFLVGNGAGSLNAGGPDFWRSDGTAPGTVGLIDINPSPGTDVRSIIDLVPLNQTMFFTVLDCLPSPTWELWRSDGTPAGTVLVKDGLNPGGYGALFPTAINGQLYFHGSNGGGTYGLWKSDGTPAGTTLVKAVALPYSPWQLAAPQPIVGVGGTVFFATADGALWKSDGTASGTALVHSVPPIDLTDADGTLVYRAPPQADSGAPNGFWTAGAASALTANDTGPTGVRLKVALVSGPAHGTLTLGEDGGFIYQPDAGFTGADHFTYTATDGADTSNPATVTINVTAM